MNGPCGGRKRGSFWSESDNISEYVNGRMWCVGGDFNVILSPHERNGVGRINSSMHAFGDFMSRAGLLDLPLKGSVHLV